MRVRSLFLLLVLLSFCALSLNAATIRVPADQPTIQAGIDAAVEGDTVLVADGTYTGDGNRDLDFGGVNMVVMSENGPQNCVIDLENIWSHRGFNFRNGENSSSIVQGFSIRNGTLSGISCQGSSPTIRENSIVGNLANWGGGIVCWNSAAIIENNMILGNFAEEGGGISCGTGSSPTIINNTIAGNTSGNNGGGILGRDSSPSVTGNIIVGNTAEYWGGGIGIWWPGPGMTVITGNTVSGNSAVECGGVGVDRQTAVIDDNTISGNTADLWIGGLELTRGSYSINNNLITNNASDSSLGGGVLVYRSSATLNNNTIAENSVPDVGGGMWVADSCVVTIANTILWNNGAAEGDEIWLGYYDSPPEPSNLMISYSDVEGGEESVFVDEGCILEWGEGMMDSDPTFVLPEKQDYRLLWESPCIDVGCPDSLDLDGTVCDMGACFFNQDDYLTLYMTPDTQIVYPGDVAGVTYTLINRWAHPVSFWMLTQAITPYGTSLNVDGPDQYTVPAGRTAQVHMDQKVPAWYPAGVSECWSRIGVPPDDIYDEDRFLFLVMP